MKILLFGRTGQVGFELQRSLAPLGTLTALETRSQESCGDFTNLDGLAETVRRYAPDVIVNAAAYTAVDKAEAEPGLAHQINAEAPAVLAREAKKMGAWLVHYSTDYVFDGSGTKRWKETDSPAPLNVYGKTKQDGEEAIRASGCKHLLFRTSWVYAARGNNFPKTMIRLAKEKDRLTIVDDQVGAPTSAELLADVTVHALSEVGRHPERAGLYHLAAGGETSWHGYAVFLLDFVRKAGIELKVSPENIVAVPSSALSFAAKRPQNSRLDTTKLESTFGLHPPDWKHGVARMLTQLLEKAA